MFHLQACSHALSLTGLKTLALRTFSTKMTGYHSLYTSIVCIKNSTWINRPLENSALWETF